MRSVWNGSISFGLVNVQVKLMAATEDHDMVSHLAHVNCGGAIGYVPTCKECNGVVPKGNQAKRYEVDGHSVIVTADELASIASEKDRTIEVVEFVPAEDIDPVMVDKSYYLCPDKSVKAYKLLATVLKDSGRVAIVQVTLRSKTRLAALSVTGKQNVMVLHTLRWPDEIREPHFDDLDKDVQLSDAEVKVAGEIVGSMHKEFNADRYKDTYREELRELVMSKTAHDVPESSDEVGDLLAKLEASARARQCHPVRQAPKMAEIRAWARKNGHPQLGDRGRIPADIVEQYQREVVPA
jgi:DNA end-binding protein Ku